MRKIYLSLIAVFLISAVGKAQTGKLALSIGPELGVPINSTNDYGRTRDYYQDGLGFNLKAEWQLQRSLYFTGSLGFAYYPTNIHYVYAPDPTINTTPDYIPMGGSEAPPYKFTVVKAGLQYYFVKYFYANGELGGAIAANSAAKTSFIYGAGIGTVIYFGTHSGLDLGVRFERGFKIEDYDYPMNQVAIRLAYRFGF